MIQDYELLTLFVRLNINTKNKPEMNSKNLKSTGLILLAFCFNFLATTDIHAQTQAQIARDKARLEAEKKAEETNEEKPMSADDKKAAIKAEGKERRKNQKMINRQYAKNNAESDKRMYTKLKMTDEQIKKYEEVNAKYAKQSRTLIKEQSGDSAALQASMQKIREEKDAGLAAIFNGDQLKEYEIFQEDEATKRTSKKYRHKVKDLPAPK